MASPAPSNIALDTDAAKDGKPAQENITFKFCRECSNMLYPKEDRMTNKLMFACRTCQFSEEASSSCVFRNTIHSTAGETSGVTDDVATDPTVRNGDFAVAPSNANESKEKDDAEEICCTLCGREIEWHCMLCGEELEITQLEVGPAGAACASDDETEAGGVKNVQGLTLEEMSRMEEEGEDMDWE